MKVHVLISGTLYSQSRIEGIFQSLKSAQVAEKKLRPRPFLDYTEIKEFEVK